MVKLQKKFIHIKNKIKNTPTLTSVLIASLLLSANVQAEERQGLLLNGAIKVESDNNVLRKLEATDDTSLQFSPKVQYLTHVGKQIFAVDYQGEYAAYNENSQLNYNNHDIALYGRLDHSLKINSEFKLSYQNEVEEPGSNNSSSLLNEKFNKTNKKLALGKFYYGTNESIGQVVFELNHLEDRYSNNFQDYRNVDRNKFTSTFFYRLAPKTRLLFQASIADYDYIIKNQFPDQSSKETFYLAGVEWDITAKTSGTFKLGYQGKDFEQEVYNDISGLSYMLDMTWMPNTYSKIKLAASRMTRESSQLVTSAFITNTYTLDAEHKITPRTKLKAAYTFDSDDIVSSQTRTDKRHNIVLSVDHSLLKWLNISLDYQYIERSSDLTAYNFKANVIGLSLVTKFK